MSRLDGKALGLQGPPNETRVVVAMSGGVDSSVAAALLAEAGFDVVGITMQLYDHGTAIQKKNACCAGQDIYDAARVSEQLGFPHYVLDYESRFKASVIDQFADTYLRGETPIPCIQCNQTVKFRDLLEAARSLDAAALVTGHYVQRVEGVHGPELHCGKDPQKDQSYFLFATTPDQLDFVRFPLGGMSKEETRTHAARFRLPVADKPDSQDICFVPAGRYAELVRKLRPEGIVPGAIRHMDGHILGEHEGIIGYTVGQRRGIGIGGGEPLYVVALNPETHEVIVGPREALAIRSLRVRDVNWLRKPTDKPEPCTIKVRSAHKPVSGTVQQTQDGADITFDEPEYGVSAGQAAVFYQGSRVLGGGWIVT